MMAGLILRLRGKLELLFKYLLQLRQAVLASGYRLLQTLLCVLIGFQCEHLLETVLPIGQCFPQFLVIGVFL